jgi:hypothetical protein
MCVPDFHEACYVESIILISVTESRDCSYWFYLFMRQSVESSICPVKFQEKMESAAVLSPCAG